MEGEREGGREIEREGGREVSNARNGITARREGGRRGGMRGRREGRREGKESSGAFGGTHINMTCLITR